ncbi:hypothetical protein J2S21_003467 [Peribacillus cavernae]|nr:hypothetical protein [Peribacillus cavernae]
MECRYHVYPNEARLDVPLRGHGLVFSLHCGLAAGQSLEIEFALETMRRALAKHKPAIINSDQGSHFTSPQYTDLLKENETRISMDGKGQHRHRTFLAQPKV